MMEEIPTTLIVMDGNATWIRSLFSAMPEHIRVVLMHPFPVSTFVKKPSSVATHWTTKPAQTATKVHHFVVPGWRLSEGWSARIAAKRIRRIVDSCDHQAIVVYTLPHYSAIASRLTDLRSVYFAFDPYSEYGGWDRDFVTRRENELFRHCSCAFAISSSLAGDFRARTDIPVYVQPNGISADTLNSPPAREPKPPDLPTDLPIALCVGQLGASYDWELIDGVTDCLQEVRFVFIGPCLGMPSPTAEIARRVLTKKNVLSLGWRDPSQLSAYLWNSNVLFSPLTVSPANNRRSLLRMYDYLATDRNIVATPIESSVEHHSYIRLASSIHEYSTAIVSSINTLCSDDEFQLRRSYLAMQTWERRAGLFLKNLGTMAPTTESKCSAR